MPDLKLHRDSQKRFYGPDKIYFITTDTEKRFPYFKEDIFCELFIENLHLCKKLKKFKLCGFNVIYDHAHILLQSGEKYNISQIMQFLKRHFSRDLNFIIGVNNEGEIRESRLQGSEYKCFIQIIKAHDKNVVQLKNKYINQAHNKQNYLPKFKWQQSFHDHVIRGEKDFNYHYNYTVNNHAKHGLSDDWPYTSLNYMDMIDEY